MNPEDGRDGEVRPQIVVIRLAAAFADAHRPSPAPIVLIGMDTPQVSVGLLTEAVSLLCGHDVVFWPASDGGFWLLELRAPDSVLLHGVPRSEPSRYAAALAEIGAPR
ncbi:DUF2064 domain-containing protein [Nonomuraea angiospora]|uniref:DUF2064 domain-containing protein n=1 Tax=Nonomuraea angiospora TaxID=46172 RepID=UPI0034413FF3